MKNTTFFSLVFAAALLGNSALGATTVEYSYNAPPSSSNDSLVNGGPATTQAWTIAYTTAIPSNFGPFDGTIHGTPMWDIYDAPGRNGSQSGEITQTNTFNYALTLDQSVSLEYATGNSLAIGGKVGLNLLDGSTTEVSIFAQNSASSDFLYTDSTNTAVSTGQVYYNSSNIMDFSFEVTGTDTYSADLNGHTFTGTFSAPITGIQVFNENGGASSDQYTTDLIEPIPEPSTYALMLGGLVLFGMLLRRRTALRS
jgi:hypothetical protein